MQNETTDLFWALHALDALRHRCRRLAGRLRHCSKSWRNARSARAMRQAAGLLDAAADKSLQDTRHTV
ncbi:MAG: hypothetical protein LBE84_06065 [Planctomycetota bacterium]|jgi:hypothetical protein|nr:hypothetical protein [Planctomycetota bacterium]